MIHFNLKIIVNLACMLDSCVSLFLEIVFSHKIVGVLIFIRICNFATRMSICSSFDCFVYLFERDIRLIGLEPMTPRLSSACSNRLSYSRLDIVKEKTVTRTANLAHSRAVRPE